MVNTQQNQTYRVLSMYDRLCSGKVLSKKEESQVFNIGERTIQRDFDSIRAFLDMEKSNQSLVYDRIQKGYKLVVRNDKTSKN
jgi:predicted DNA-binding transcriptional regulator YafY